MAVGSTSPSRRWWRNGAIAVGLVVTGAALLLVFFDWNWLRGPIEKAVTAATGRRLEIAGKISGEWRLHPRLRMENVRFANPAWARSPYLLTAEAVDLQIELIPLFRRRVHLRDLRLVKPVVALERVTDGRATWLLDRDQRDNESVPRIDALRVESGSLEFHDALTRARLTASVQDRGNTSATTGLRFTITGQFREQAIDLRGESSSLLEFRGAGALPIAIRGTVAGTRIELQGTIDNLARWQQVNLRYSVQGSSLKRLAPVLEAPLPETPAYTVSGVLIRSGPRWETRDLRGKVGKSDVSGQVVVTTGGLKPDLEARLTSRLLDLADLGPLIGLRGAGDPPRPADATRILPDRPFDLTRLGALDARVTLTATQVVHAAAIPFDDFRADLVLADGQIRIDPLELGMANGKLRARVALDPRKPLLVATLAGRVRDLDVAKIFPGRGAVGTAAGTLSGSFDLRGQGPSVGAVLGTADGRATLLLRNGRVPTLLPAIADLDGARVLRSLLGGEPEFVQCSAIDLGLKRGMATPAVAIFETESTVLNVTGSIDLASERLDLRLAQAPKKPSFLSLRTPILITGSLKAPAFAPDPGPLAGRTAAALLLALVNPLAALFATIETGPGEEGTCVETRGALRAKRLPDGTAPGATTKGVSGG